MNALSKPFSESLLLQGFFIFSLVVCRDGLLEFHALFRQLHLFVELLNHDVIVTRHQLVIPLLVLLIPIIFCLELLHRLDQLLDNRLLLFG